MNVSHPIRQDEKKVLSVCLSVLSVCRVSVYLGSGLADLSRIHTQEVAATTKKVICRKVLPEGNRSLASVRGHTPSVPTLRSSAGILSIYDAPE